MNARTKNINANRSSRKPTALTTSAKRGYEEKNMAEIRADVLFLNTRKPKIKTRTPFKA
jgi:hypothetical protein